MTAKKRMVVGVVLGVISTITAVAGNPDPSHVFRTTTGFLLVGQGTSSNTVTHVVKNVYNYAQTNGTYLSAQVLGAAPNSNQVFAMRIDCASSAASLVVFDKSNSNTTLIATSDSIDTVEQDAIKKGHTDDERFVALFNVVPTNNLAGGFLSVAGRLHLDSNGCPVAVSISIDRDPKDGACDDRDVPNGEQDGKSKDSDLKTKRAGQAHFDGVLDILSGGTTNTVLIPRGHMTFRRELE